MAKTNETTLIKIAGPFGPRGGQVVIERKARRKVKNRTTAVRIGGKLVTVVLPKHCRLWKVS